MTELHFSNDSEPGITREKRADDWIYLNPNGMVVEDSTVIERLNSLAMPPAYSGLWYCSSAMGHLQATGRDISGKKQYRYHPLWRKQRDSLKFERLGVLAERLPTLRRRVRDALRGARGHREMALAIATRLMDKEGLRVGNDIYLESNGTRGASTLGKQNIEFGDDGHFWINYIAKGGREVDLDVQDKLLDRAIQQCHELPGQRLLSYRHSDGQIYDVDSGKLNAYIKALIGNEFSVKDLRTWRASAACVEALLKSGVKQAEKALLGSIKEAARTIRNRYPTCRKHYIHPVIEQRIKTCGVQEIQKEEFRDRSELTKSESLLAKWLTA